MLYFTKLPDHKSRDFNERLHFDTFSRHNITFNAMATKSRCDDHVGCLSIKTVMSGEEVYEFNGLQKSVRPGQFLILNGDHQLTGSYGFLQPIEFIHFFTAHYCFYREAEIRKTR